MASPSLCRGCRRHCSVTGSCGSPWASRDGGQLLGSSQPAREAMHGTREPCRSPGSPSAAQQPCHRLPASVSLPGGCRGAWAAGCGAGSCHKCLKMTRDVSALAEGYNNLWREWEEVLGPQERVGGKTQELTGKDVQPALWGCPRARAGGQPCTNTRVRRHPVWGDDSWCACQAHAGTWRSFESSLLRTWSLP